METGNIILAGVWLYACSCALSSTITEKGLNEARFLALVMSIGITAGHVWGRF